MVSDVTKQGCALRLSPMGAMNARNSRSASAYRFAETLFPHPCKRVKDPFESRVMRHSDNKKIEKEIYR